MNIQRSFATDFLGSFGAKLITTVFALLTSIVTARIFGPDGKGLVTMALLVLSQIGLFLSLGVDISLVHYAGRKRWPITELASASISLALTLGTAGTLIALAVFAFGLSEGVGEQVFPALVLLALSVPVAMVATFVRSLLNASGRLVEASFLAFLKTVLAFVAIVTALLLDLGLVGVLLGQVLASLSADVVLLMLAVRWRIIAGTPTVDWSIWRTLVTYGLKAHVGSVLQALNYRFDLFLVAFFLGTAGVGLYSTAVALSEWLWLLPGVLGSSIMQRAATKTPDQVNALMGPVNRLTSAVLLAGMLVLALTGNWIIPALFGPGFAPSYAALLLLLPGVWSLGLWKNLMNDLSGRGYPAAKSYTAGVAVVLTLVLDVLLIPGWGIAGAALASSIAYTAALIAALWLYRRVTSYHLREILVPDFADLQLALTSMRNVALPRASRVVGRRRNRT